MANKFEKVSEQEYNKSIVKEFGEKFSILNYSELRVPYRATKGSAGYDFFSPISFKLKPGESIKVPTGIKCGLNYGGVLMLFPRSSYGFKYRMQLDNTIGVVDQDYYNNPSNEGHIFIKVTNDSKDDKTFEVNCGDAFAQGIIMNYELVDDDNTVTTRVGGIGSTTNN